MLPLIAFICVLKPVRQRKQIFNRKTSDFSLSSVWFLIFHKKFSSYNSVWIRFRVRIRIRTFFSDSDSDPAKTFGLFRIRIHNTGCHAAVPGIDNKFYNIDCFLGSFCFIRTVFRMNCLTAQPSYEERAAVERGQIVFLNMTTII
jgi:hypothetical protein